MREFAAKELTGLANEWQADDDEKKMLIPLQKKDLPSALLCQN